MAKENEELEVFDRALESAHPIFHGYLKAAKEHAVTSRQFSKFLESYGKESDGTDNK